MPAPASSDADLIRSLRAEDFRARTTLAARYRPLVRRLVLACQVLPGEADGMVNRVLDTAFATVMAPGPAPVDFGAALSVALRDEIAGMPGRSTATTGVADEPSAVDSVLRDAGLASAELVASWRMMLWAVHVEQIDVTRAAQVADVRPDEALAVLRRAEEALANGVIARALQRSDSSHAVFLQLMERRAVGALEQDETELLDAHSAICESCGATGRWLTSFRSAPGATLAAASLGSAAQHYLRLTPGIGARATPLVAASSVLRERARGLLVTTFAVAAAVGLFVVAVTAPAASTFSAQLLRDPTPTTVGAPPTTALPIRDDLPATTPRASPITAPSTGTGPGWSSLVPTRNGGGQATAVTGGGSGSTVSTDDTDDTAGAPGPTIVTTAVSVTPRSTRDAESVDGTAVTPRATASWIRSIVPSATATSLPGPPGPTTAVPTTAVPTTVPTSAVPTTGVPTTAVPTTAVPTTAVPPITAVPTAAVPTTPTRPTASRPGVKPTPLPPTTTTTISAPPSPPSLIGVRLGDDWSHLEISVGLGFSRTTLVRNDSAQTSAPVVVVAESSRSLLMNLTANGRPCGPVGLLARTVSCSIGTLAPGATVQLTFSATLPLLVVGRQTASVSLVQE